MISLKSIFLLFLSITVTNIHQTNFDSKNISDEVYSSYVDPEECYSIGKAYGDCGIFPDNQFKGQGIKIGIIDNGIPMSL